MILERIKALYLAGVITNLDNYVRLNLITAQQAEEIRREKK
jgi:hypothetical protein